MSKAIGYVHDEFVYAKFMKCVVLTSQYEQAMVLNVEGNNVAQQRNSLVRNFLDTGREWLYMCDTDTLFPIDVISKLLLNSSPDVRIISALVYRDGDPPMPMMYDRVADLAAGIGMFQTILEWEPDALLEVDVVGAGCLLVHRDVYLEMEKRLPGNKQTQWFEYTNFCGMSMGEDFTFCLRARDAGFQVYVDTSVRIGHIKSRVI